MDPNETLCEIRQLVHELENAEHFSHLELVERVKALDEWLTHGGFLPDAWRSASDSYPPEMSS